MRGAARKGGPYRESYDQEKEEEEEEEDRELSIQRRRLG